MNASELKDEIQITWLYEPDQFRYVRQGMAITNSRYRSVQLARDAVLVGYGVLHGGARGFGRPRRWYRRRIFWLMPTDPYREGAPAEAVDPSTVRPGVAGVATERMFAITNARAG